MTIVVTFGTYDLFHVGHLNILQRAKDLGYKGSVMLASQTKYPPIGPRTSMRSPGTRTSCK